MDEAETEILTDPDQRIIHQVVVEDVIKANKLFEDLMGEGVLPRKEFIKNHALEASYDM